MSFWVGNTPDNQSGVISFDVTFKYKVLKLQERYTVSLQADQNDDKYSLRFLSSTSDLCKLSQGITGTIYTKMMFQSILKVLDFNFTCPFAKNLSLKMKNATVFDTFVPPFLFEKKFKLVDNLYGLIERKKGFVPLYSFELFGSVKK